MVNQTWINFGIKDTFYSKNLMKESQSMRNLGQPSFLNLYHNMFALKSNAKMYLMLFVGSGAILSNLPTPVLKL